MLLTLTSEDALAWAREEGVEEGLEKGQELSLERVARNALAEGATPEFVQKITGLDLEAIKQLGVSGFPLKKTINAVLPN